MTDIAALFRHGALGAIELPNRVVMAPMTRSRAGEGDVPGDLAVTYYKQRATAGLIITEGTQPSANGKGYCRTPGIYSEAQIAGWRKVVAAVRDQGGQLVMQIMHCGRIASHYNKEEGAETVAPSAIQANGQMFTDSHGMVDFDMPRALGIEEIPGIVEEYVRAAKNAMNAGCVGVEVHGTSGYLPVAFLSTGTNQRKDAYGGDVNNRIRFVMEVLEATSAAIGAERVGLRICPGNPFNDLHDDHPEETFTALLKAVSPMKLAYLHVIRLHDASLDNIALAKARFKGPLIVNDGYNAKEAADLIEDRGADAVSFARHYIANPDLVEKFKTGATLAKFNPKTLYVTGSAGYTDY